MDTDNRTALLPVSADEENNSGQNERKEAEHAEESPPVTAVRPAPSVFAVLRGRVLAAFGLR